MGKLALVVAKDGAEEIPVNRSIADADLDRIGRATVYNWFRDGVPVDGGDPRPPTSEEVANRLGDWIIEQMVSMTADAEARMAAAAAPPPIEVKPA